MPSGFSTISKILLVFFLAGFFKSAKAQDSVLTLKGAIRYTLANYAGIKSKQNLVKSYSSNVKEARSEYLPNLSVSGQQVYGTAAGQYGPSYGFNGLSVSSSGPILNKSNWNSSFGALYLGNVSWDFFAFGKAKERVKVSKTQFQQSEADLNQETFQDEIKVSSAYLNLLAADRLLLTQTSNLERSIALQTVVRSRTKSGLNPGVDSSQANAQVSSAKIALTNVLELRSEQLNALAAAMGIEKGDLRLDTAFVKILPAKIDTLETIHDENHPILQFYNSRIRVSQEQSKYLRTFQWPTFSFFSVYQDRGSGFNADYGSNLNDYSHSYGKGVNPTVGNYLVGIGLTWNLTSILRYHHQYQTQKYVSDSYQNDFEVQQNQLHNQLILSRRRITNALRNYNEAPIEVKAASEAYLQKSVLYKNGLATIIDLTTALFVLNQAETDREIAYNNVWQAILFQAAATGDFASFYNQLQ